MSETTPDIKKIDFEAEMLELTGEVEKQARKETKKIRPPAKTNARKKTTRENLEKRLRTIEKLLSAAQALPSSPTKDPSPDLKKVTKLLSNVAEELQNKNTVESANQRLFDALHSELHGYKDNFLFDTLQRPFIRDLISLYDDLARQAQTARDVLTSLGDSAPDAMSGLVTTLTHNVDSLLEIFYRLDVSLIEDAAPRFDKSIHRAVAFDPAAKATDDGLISKHVRAGFRWRDSVLRPVDVVVMKTQ